jgi:hypothetical protein
MADDKVKVIGLEIKGIGEISLNLPENVADKIFAAEENAAYKLNIGEKAHAMRDMGINS